MWPPETRRKVISMLSTLSGINNNDPGMSPFLSFVSALDGWLLSLGSFRARGRSLIRWLRLLLPHHASNDSVYRKMEILDDFIAVLLLIALLISAD